MVKRSLTSLLGIAVVLSIAFCATADDTKSAAQPSAKGDTPTEPGGTPDANAAAPGKGDTSAPGTTTPGKSTSTAKTEKAKGKTEKATFATGCFWCGEAVFERIEGVKSVVSGYTGGTVPNPTYEEVSSGLTGHAEGFQVEYDPAVAPYDKLLKVFWASHDPTTPNQQGPDFGTQYRSVIFYHNDAQKEAAQKSYQELTNKGSFFGAIVTQLVPAGPFYPAEAYHQDYYKRHRSAMYCQMYITPKLKKLHLIK